LAIEHARNISDKNTLLFTLSANGVRVRGIAFGLNAKFNEGAKYIDAVFTIEKNVYNGMSSAQLRIRDFVLR
jgi:hypothetical protein